MGRMARKYEDGWSRMAMNMRTGEPRWMKRWIPPSRRSSLKQGQLTWLGYFPGTSPLLPILVWFPYATWLRPWLPPCIEEWMPQWPPPHWNPRSHRSWPPQAACPVINLARGPMPKLQRLRSVVGRGLHRMMNHPKQHWRHPTIAWLPWGVLENMAVRATLTTVVMSLTQMSPWRMHLILIWNQSLGIVSLVWTQRRQPLEPQERGSERKSELLQHCQGLFFVWGPTEVNTGYSPGCMGEQPWNHPDRVGVHSQGRLHLLLSAQDDG